MFRPLQWPLVLHDKREVTQMEILPRVRSRSKGGERGGQTFLHVSMLEIPCKPSLVDRPDNTQPYKRQKLPQKTKGSGSFLLPSLPLPCLVPISELHSFLPNSQSERPGHGEMNLHPHWCITHTFTFFFSTQNETTQRVKKKGGNNKPHH